MRSLQTFDNNFSSQATSRTLGRISRKDSRRRNKDREHKAVVRDEGLKELLQVLLKQTLMNTQATRELKSIMLDTIELDEAAGLVEAMRAEGKRYAAAVREQGKGHTLGPPACSTFLAMLEAMMAEDVGALNKKKIKEWHEHLSDGGLEVVQLHIRVCRFEKCYKDGRTKLIVGIVGAEEHRHVILASLRQMGGRLEGGQGSTGIPRGGAGGVA